MATPPPRRVIEAFLQPISHITRRVEIYESDGITPWKPELWDEILVADGGSVSASYGDKERRTFECSLDNHDGELDPVPGGLWYDKIFKVFYGIDVTATVDSQPRILICEEVDSPGQAQRLRSILYGAGYQQVHYNPDASSMADLASFDVIISVTRSTSRKATLLQDAWYAGKSIMTFAGGATRDSHPVIIGSTLPKGTATEYFEIEPVDSVLYNTATRWSANPPEPYTKVTGLAVNTQEIASAYYPAALEGAPSYPGIIATTMRGRGSWIHVMQNHFDREVFADAAGNFSQGSYDSFRDFMTSSIKHLHGDAGEDYYECQIGEFVSSSIGHADESGDTVSISCIDYTKRCSDSKLAAATMFEQGEVIEDIIRAVASNCGIRKFNMPVTGEGIQRDITFERDTPRWDVMYKLASELGYDLFFDGEGRLTMRKNIDPAKDAPSLTLAGGVGGNLVSRKLVTSDARLFNHIVVVGESADSDTDPVWAEAINTQPASPTSIDKIGSRVRIETMSSITSKDKAKEVAAQMLAVSMLEEFDLSFVSVFFPWIEPGELVEYTDETRQHWGPSRYMITSLSLPLDLGPMSGTGKRVVNLQ